MVPSTRISWTNGHRDIPGPHGGLQWAVRRRSSRRADTGEMTVSLNLQEKQAVVAEVAKQVAGAQAIVMAENRGMAVADMTKLRAKARESGVYFRVVKN